jgi:hypothetical protein
MDAVGLRAVADALFAVGLLVLILFALLEAKAGSPSVF